jgi:hypothetical protein
MSCLLLRSWLARTALALLLGCVACTPFAQPLPNDADPMRYVQFVEEFSGNCVARQAKQILVKNTHPTRTLRVWLDRYLMGNGTGDRSRSDLAAGAEPEALGCSLNSGGAQEWRLVRATFVD